jgi:hypothetical protein
MPDQRAELPGDETLNILLIETMLVVFYSNIKMVWNHDN